MTDSLNIHHVTSLEVEELSPYRTLRRPMDHYRQGIFVAEGEKVVRRLLQSNIEIISMLLTPEWFDQLFAVRESDQRVGFTVFIAPKQLLQTIVGFHLHQGIMALGRIPPQGTLEDTLQQIASPHLLVALDGLNHAENIGIIVRNAAGFGVDAVIVGQTSCSPYLRRAVRNSMGTAFTLPIIHVEQLVTALTTLKRQFRTIVYATEPSSPVPLSSVDLTGNVCIVFGNEDAGVSREILRISHQRVAIPMQQRTDSLNVASASAICLYEARKQRQE
jgi:tRNA G18 (ribose-2'-O)-methylase SpoU